jgi:hypothetical protein
MPTFESFVHDNKKKVVRLLNLGRRIAQIESVESKKPKALSNTSLRRLP